MLLHPSEGVFNCFRQHLRAADYVHQPENSPESRDYMKVEMLYGCARSASPLIEPGVEAYRIQDLLQHFYASLHDYEHIRYLRVGHLLERPDVPDRYDLDMA